MTEQVQAEAGLTQALDDFNQAMSRLMSEMAASIDRASMALLIAAGDHEGAQRIASRITQRTISAVMAHYVRSAEHGFYGPAIGGYVDPEVVAGLSLSGDGESPL